MKKPPILVSIFVTTCALLTACKFEYTETKSADLQAYRQKNGQSDKQYQIDMIFGDFHGLSTETVNTNAYPLKLAVSALLLQANLQEHLPVSLKTYEQILQRYGFYRPESIANLSPGVPQPEFTYPVGIIHGTLDVKEVVHAKVEIMNITCGSCHGGVTYDAQGLPSKSTWLGSPNTSLNIQGYVNKVYEALKAARGHDKEILKIVKQVFPNIGFDEYETLRFYVLGTSKKTIDEYESHGDDILGYSSGPPGAVNAVGAFKKMFGIIPHFGKAENEVGYVDIPDMAYRGLKSNLTVDGTYTVPGETDFSPLTLQDATPAKFESLGVVASSFPISALGVKASRTEDLIPELKKTVGSFFANYKPPIFPGDIDVTKASAGEKIFQNNCTGCHGSYETYTSGMKQLALQSFPNKLIPLDKIGTDPERVNLVTDALEKALEATWISQYVKIAKHEGYMPQVLSGLWATAPYLHNGSVPTIWQFMNPELRPQKFQVGGHHLDFGDLGILGHSDSSGVYRYDDLYSPWSEPVLVDASLPGHSNLGHERPFANLNLSEKRELLEYLKLL